MLNLFKFFLNKILLYLVIFLVFCIPFNFSILHGKSIEKEKNYNVQVLFDVSLSMTADDIKPSRFDSAKSSLINLMNSLEGYNVSLITFSGIPFVWSPFSDRTNIIINKLNDVKMSDFPPTINFVGTAIGDAILLGIKNLSDMSYHSTKPGVIILITDGDSNKGSEPLQAAQIAKSKGIPIFTLGVGNNDYIVGYDHFNRPVNTTINIDLLKNIAKVSGGNFYRVLSDNEFKNILDEIGTLIKQDELILTYNEYLHINDYLIWLLFLTSIFFIVINGKIIFFYFTKR